MFGCLSSCGQLEPHKRGSGRGVGENALMLWIEQFPVPVINLLSPNILPCPLSEIREDKDSVKMRAMGDKSSATLGNEIRRLIRILPRGRMHISNLCGLLLVLTQR